MIRRTGKKLEAIKDLVQIKWNQAELFGFEIDKNDTKTFLKQYTDAVEPLYKLTQC